MPDVPWTSGPGLRTDVHGSDLATGTTSCGRGSRCPQLQNGMVTQQMGNESGSASAVAPRILLVEDSDDLRALMVLVLESEGYSVDAVPTAQEALELLNRCPYDLLLSDYALPGHTGAWLVRQALDRRLVCRHCAVIITAHPNPADTAGVQVLRKPLDFESFVRYVRELLD